MNGLTPLEESPVTQFFHSLWKRRGGTAESVANTFGAFLPTTVVYEHNFPKGLYYSSNNGVLNRRQGKEIDSKVVVDIIIGGNKAAHKSSNPAASLTMDGTQGERPGSPVQAPTSPELSPLSPSKRPTSQNTALTGKSGGAGDIVAMYVEGRQPDRANASQGVKYVVQFLTAEGLQAFLLGLKHRPSGGKLTDDPSTCDVTIVGNKNGMLQKFVYPIGDHNELIQVVWTSHLCIVEKTRNMSSLTDTTKTPFRRCATYQGPASFSSRAYVAPLVADKIRRQCEEIVQHLYNVDRRVVDHITLYFKIDMHEKLWLLWCSGIRYASEDSVAVTGMPMQMPSGDRRQTSRPSTFGSLRNVAPGSKLMPEYIIPKAYRGSTSMSRKALTDEESEALEKPDPTLKFEPLDQPSSGRCIVPTKSRLWQGLTWLKKGANTSTTSGKDRHPRLAPSIAITQSRSMTLAAAADAHVRDTVSPSGSFMISTPSGAPAKAVRAKQRQHTRPGDGIPDYDPPEKSLKHVVYDTSDLKPGQSRQDLVYALAATDVPAFLSGPAAEEMNFVKESVNATVDFLEALEYTVYSHFLLETVPFAFSIPPTVAAPKIRHSLITFLKASCTPCSMAEAKQMDEDVGRLAAEDDLSYHLTEHHEADHDIPCYFVENDRVMKRVTARLDDYCLRTLRNLHSDIEFLLCAESLEDARKKSAFVAGNTPPLKPLAPMEQAQLGSLGW